MSGRRVGSVPISWIAVLAVALVVVGWWGWPSVNGSSDQLDVLVVADPAVVAGETTIARAVRGDGLSAAFAAPADDWCSAAPVIAEAVAARSPSIVVLSFASLGGCGSAGVQAAIAAAGDRRVIVVAQAGDARDSVLAVGDAVDPARLVGADAVATRMTCKWWDACDNGSVAVRDDAGHLTDAGFERVARLLVAQL